MKLGTLGKALELAHDFGLDGTDLLILRDIADKQAQGEEATIMSFASAKFASFGTVHARIKRMVRSGFLVKRIKEDNQRIKVLDRGPTLQKLIDKLTDI
jgi:DNA-binding MarR family transcriptional regulator